MSLRLCPKCSAPTMNFREFLLRGLSNTSHKCRQCGAALRRETGARVALPNVMIAGLLYVASRSQLVPHEIRNPIAVVGVILAAVLIMGFATFGIARWLPKN